MDQCITGLRDSHGALMEADRDHGQPSSFIQPICTETMQWPSSSRVEIQSLFVEAVQIAHDPFQ
eukprot:1147267-Pyramimonas_sp.AAC.1